MRDNRLLRVISFAFVVLMIAVLAWLTLPAEEDPCANTEQDINAAVLADQPGDQDALVNRAIILKGNCEKKAAQK